MSTRFLFSLLLCASWSMVTHAQIPEPDIPAPMTSLKTVPVPGLTQEHIRKFIKNKKAVIKLGKALFWETKVGSDNKTACATCHFHAGTDGRTKNIVSPGLLAGDNTFQFAIPNQRLLAENFPIPFRRYNHHNDVVSSQGAFNTVFVAARTGAPDNCEDEADAIFHGISQQKILNTRRVEPRNTPSVINAVFNFRNFWDGRANNVFNGVDPFGLRNENAFVWKVEYGELKKVKVAIPFSSLASQSSGPPLNGFEMSCKQRLFLDIAKKLLNEKILSAQSISLTDSVLGAEATNRPTYSNLIKQAFQNEWWDSNKPITYSTADASIIGSSDLIDPPIFSKRIINHKISLMESNFSLLFGLAIQMYESTLVADDTPLDRFLEGNLYALSAQQKRGKKIFENKGKCLNCHSGAELTNASVRNVTNERLEKMIMGDDFIATYDNGFYNIGVRPTNDDLGVGGTDPFGNPLSETRMVKNGKEHLLGHDFDPTRNPTAAQINRVAVNGAFKTPGLRNVELTGPYFHNGGKSTLMQVVDFYDRGGDFRNENQDDLDPDIRRLHLSDQEKEDLVSFLLSMTDERVRLKKAPFDHPSICVPDGHKGNEFKLYRDGKSMRAIDDMRCMQAIGKLGVKKQFALKPFLKVDHFRGDEFKKSEVVSENK